MYIVILIQSICNDTISIMINKKNLFFIFKFFLLVLIYVFGGIFLIRVLFFQIISFIDWKTYPNQNRESSEFKISENILECPTENKELQLEELSTDNFSIYIPKDLSKKDSSFFATPTWIFACKTPDDKIKGSESVRIYIETAGPFNLKMLQSEDDCMAYYNSLYSNNSLVTKQLMNIEFDTFSIEFNKCLLKYSLSTKNQESFIFERLIILPAFQNSKPQQFDIYAYYPPNTPSNLVEALNQSVNSFKLHKKIKPL